jgi:hypothetical protein
MPAKTIHIRDQQFIRLVRPVSRLRRHKTMTKTVQQLAQERLTELRIGQFIPAEDVSAAGGGERREGADASPAR